MPQLECMNCFERFSQDASDAKTSVLYCSATCETESDTQLSAGNKIVADAEENRQLDTVRYHTGSTNIADSIASAQMRVRLTPASPIKIVSHVQAPVPPVQNNSALDAILEGLTPSDVVDEN